jgi:hypothetical protein
MPPTEPNTLATRWLLSSPEPGVRLRTRRDVLGEPVPDAAFAEIWKGPKATALLDGLDAPGPGWRGTQWRLLALVDLGAPATDPRFVSAADRVVDQALRRPQHRGRPTVIDGRHRFCANVEGIALTVGSRAGLAAPTTVLSGWPPPSSNGNGPTAGGIVIGTPAGAPASTNPYGPPRVSENTHRRPVTAEPLPRPGARWNCFCGTA